MMTKRGFKQIVHHGMVLRTPSKQPEGAEGKVVYELGKCFQLDRSHCLLVASMDEQGGADLCVGNDGFIIEKLSDISPQSAIPINRPDRNYRLESGETGFLAKYPVTGGFVPLGALLPDGTPHPAAGTGIFHSTAGVFSPDKKNLIEDKAWYHEFIQLRWDGERLQITQKHVTDTLMGMELAFVSPLSAFCPDGDSLLVPFCVIGKGFVVFRFEWNGEEWLPTSYGSPFGVDPASCGDRLDLVREMEPSLLKMGDQYIIYTRGNDPFGRIYSSTDGMDFTLLYERPNHTVPQALNQGLDGSIYLATNPGPGWIRNPLLAYPMLDGSFGEPTVIHDEGGIRGDDGPKIPFVDHGVGSNVYLEDRWRHLCFYRVSDLKERTLYAFQADSEEAIHGHSGYAERSETSGLYLAEMIYDETTHVPFLF